MSVEEILEKLLGKIKPVGETNEDNNRYENIENYKKACNFIFSRLEEASLYADRKEYSMQKIGKECNEFLRDYVR